jgi:hypothetical protein
MSRFGRYEVVEELYRTALATVSRARGTAIGDAKYVVKSFTPPAFAAYDEQDAGGEAAFLERAGLQQKVAAERSSRHWAAVHDLGKQNDAAFFVTDYYPLTAQKLITGRVSMTPASLHRLVAAVVRGLRELNSVADRPHGNLKPTNVLIAGQGESAGAAGIVLTDPAPTARLSTWGEQSDDLVALGHLIHQLVLHRPFRSPGSWPLEKSNEWSALGRFGDRWRDLCNRLLDPTGQQRPADLTEVSRLVARLGSNRKRRLTQLGIGLAVVAALAAGGGLFAVQLDRTDRACVLAANNGWLGELHRRAREEPGSLDACRTDPTLAALLEADAAATQRGVRFDVPAALPRDGSAPDAFRKARAAAEAVRDLESRLAPAEWPLLKDATARVQTFRARGWAQPAEALGRVTSAVSSTRDASFWKSVDELLALRPHAISSDTAADRAWRSLEAALAAPLKKGGEPARVRDELAARARAAAKLTPAGLSGAETFDACAAAVKAWAALDQNPYDAAALASEMSAGRLDVRSAEPAALEAFARDVAPRVAVVNMGASPDIAAALKSFEQTKSFADADRKSDAQRKAYEAAKAEVAVLVTKMNGAGGGTAADVRALREKVDAFAKRWSSASDPTAWLRTAGAASLPGINSPALQGAWTRWRAAAGLTRAKDDDDVPAEIREATERWRAAIAALEQRFPRAPAEGPALPKAFADAAAERREEEIAKILPAAIAPDRPLPAALRDPGAAAKPFQQWLANLAALAKDFPVREPLSDAPPARPDEAWAKRDPAFWQDARVQALVRSEVRRLAELARVRTSSDRAELASLAGDEGSRPAIAIAAWRRLGALDPPWPANVSELESEAKMRAALSRALASVDSGDRPTAERELAAQGPARWCRVVNAIGPDNPADLDRAAGLAAGFAVSLDAATGALPADVPVAPPARFNLLLRAARVASTKAASDAEAAKLAASFATALPAEVKPRVAPLLADLSKLDRKPWFPAAAKAAGKDRMTLTVGSLAPDLEFVRVKGDGIAPFYLCITEVSVALFREAAGKEAKALLPDAPPPAGAFSWSWSGDTLQAGVGKTFYWFAEDSPEVQGGFAESLRQSRFNRLNLSAEKAGGNPSDAHPIQKLPPTAALAMAGKLGCRLPSPAEWSAALATVKDVKDWNLRDATFATQRDYAARPADGRPAVVPDAGIFVPAGASVARGAKAEVKSASAGDTTLFFSPVRPDPPLAGRTFYHLIGNVAEFTFDAPEAFEDLPDKSAASVAALLKSRAKSLAVIGGSALSPPEVPVDRPQPVGDLSTGYADVGFRLAFSEPAGSPLARLRAVLAAQPLLASKPD